MEGEQRLNQLLDEYFKRDLTEAEEEQLAQWLSSSGEASQRFIGLMESHYRALGLAEPEWAESPLPKFFPKSRNPGLWLILAAFLLLALAAGGVLLHRWLTAQGRVAASIPSTAAMKKGGRPSSTQPNETIKKARTTETSTKGRIREELSVVVDNPHMGLVTVKVLDSSKSEIRVIYAGILAAGQKTFTWDGKDKSGLVSPRGVYYLEVASGAHMLRKEVHLGSGR